VIVEGKVADHQQLFISPFPLSKLDVRGAANGTPKYVSTPGNTPLAPFTTIGSPFEVSGYMVTLGAAAVAFPTVDALALAGEADPVAVDGAEATETMADVAEEASPIADETEAEASCRGRSGDATTPLMASRGRSWTSIVYATSP